MASINGTESNDSLGGIDNADAMSFRHSTSTGKPFYDADGAGGGDAQLVAAIQGAPTATPFG